MPAILPTLRFYERLNMTTADLAQLKCSNPGRGKRSDACANQAACAPELPAPENNARSWYGAPRILDTLLALCEPPGWDLSPTQRIGRRNAATNPLRMWSLIERVAGEAGAAVGRLRVHGPPLAWLWEPWRQRDRSRAPVRIEILIGLTTGTLRFSIDLDDEPALTRKMELRPVLSDEEGDDVPAWHWICSPPRLPLAYPQARAFVAALAFWADCATVEI